MKQPRYQKIAETIAQRIAAGRYTPGAKIPSIRQFAEAFACNKLTVHRAFEVLRAKGLIENRVGSGSYVRFPEKINPPPASLIFAPTTWMRASFPTKRFRPSSISFLWI